MRLRNLIAPVASALIAGGAVAWGAAVTLTYETTALSSGQVPTSDTSADGKLKAASFTDDGSTLTLGTVLGNVTTQSGTTYTLAATDCGTTVRFSAATAVTITIPATLPVKCSIGMEQAGAGQLAVNGSAVTPATLHSAHSYIHSFAQWAIIGIFIESNSGGSAAVAIFTGDGAT